MGETPTVLESPTVAAPPPRTGPEPFSQQLSSPETVLHTAEVEQSRRMAITGVIFNVVALASSPFIGGDPAAKLIAQISLAGALANNAWLWYRAAGVRRYSERTVVIFFAVASLMNVGITYFLGAFGPILVMFVFNVYTACLGYGRRVALVTLIGSIGPYVALAGPLTLGWIADPGLTTTTPSMGTVGRGIVMVSFSVFLVLVYAQARAAREIVVSSLAERDEAVRKASYREALLLETRRDLELAMQAGGLGRFSDQTLGSYKLGGVLARGGMGEVYEAVNVKDGSVAAVKMLLPEVSARPDFVRRFLREVRIAASLDSPHVVRVLEVGGETAPMPYLAMERLEGEDLAQILRRQERLPPAEVIELVRQVGRGVRVASEAGVVHRDLKPQNVFLTRGDPPIWKVLDFGVSKLADQGGTLTEGFAVGTPQYMAPEQVRNDDVGSAADMYALGAIAYRAITGCQPFPKGDASKVLMSVLLSMPIRPSSLTNVPREVDLVLVIAMAKDPNSRFESGDALAAALEAALVGRIEGRLRRRAAALLEAFPWLEPEPLT